MYGIDTTRGYTISVQLIAMKVRRGLGNKNQLMVRKYWRTKTTQDE